MSGRQRAVFLDRDGVLNRAIVRDGKPYPPASIAELAILDEARSACQRLREAGFRLVGITNQPDIARGIADYSTVYAINRIVCEELALDALYVCPHDDADGCDCRKPRPGLIVRAARELDIDLSASFMIGDRWRDIEAGNAAGCASIFLDRRYAEKRPAQFAGIVSTTDEAARLVLSGEIGS